MVSLIISYSCSSCSQSFPAVTALMFGNRWFTAFMFCNQLGWFTAFAASNPNGSHKVSTFGNQVGQLLQLQLVLFGYVCLLQMTHQEPLIM